MHIGDVGKMKVTLVWAGQDKRYQVNNVATTASTLSCYVAIQAFEPDLIISAGTAGGLKVPAVKLQMYILVVNVFFIREEFQTVELDIQSMVLAITGLHH